ncbi:MAG TPA: HAD-IA family hydrolase [Chthoniobacterales bacterium]|nr:HAD-IA family hydrolase [Chthoniobacterales bacterium]
MIRAIFFDMGGTLDGDGLHWLDRFRALYRDFGAEFPDDAIRRAFDEAERRSSLDESIASADLARMIELHVSWQLAHLGSKDPRLERHLIDGFIAPVREAAVANAQLLAELVERGFTLGVISNGCGNVGKLCADLGYSRFLTVIADSRRVGLFKPDPAIFRYAAEELGGDPGKMMMVGDSFERDVRPARKAGMKTAWLEGIQPRECSEPRLVDLRLRKLADLPAALSSFDRAHPTPNKPSLRAGLLAAGRGERLRPQAALKPLVKVDGRTLIERVLLSMAEAGASEVIVIINEDSLAVRDHVTASEWPFLIRWIVETTPTSMHSFLRLVETLAMDGDDGPFLISTVDTVAGAHAYAQFMTEARRHEEAAVVLALTSPGNDEKPLLVRCAPGDSRILAIGAAAAPSDFATAGLYAVRGSILREAEAARHEGIDALRTFLGRLLDRGYRLAGIPIARSIDVDRPGDIRSAEELLRSTAV